METYQGLKQGFFSINSHNQETILDKILTHQKTFPEMS